MRMKLVRWIPIFVLTAIGCSDPQDPSDQREPPRSFTVQETRLADATVGFGLRLFKEVSKTESAPNVMISPLSVSVALGMTMNGAESSTYDAMRSALGFGTLVEQEINEGYRGLIAQLLARDPRLTFSIANSIWHERTFQVKQPFLDATRAFFGAEVTPLNFADPSAPTTISAWAERETGGRIKELVKEISQDEIMFLVNAVYFKAPWSQAFDDRSTRTGAFTRANGSTVSVPLMSRDGAFRWVKNVELQGLELFYGDSAFSMVVLSPASGTPLDGLAASLTTEKWNHTLTAMQNSRAIVTLPRFKFEFGKKLNDPLSTLGMGIAFDENLADFDRIANR